MTALVPPDVVTVTFTAPQVLPGSEGETAVIWVPAEFTVKLVAALPPNFTEVAPVKFVPVIVTEVPPKGQFPTDGLTAVTVGAEPEDMV